VHDLGRLDGGHEVREHRDLLVLVPQEEDRSDGARAADARRLLADVVDVPSAFKGEPARLKAVPRDAAPGFATFQVGDEADAFDIEEAKGIGGKSPSIKDQCKRAGPMDLANLRDGAGNRACERIVEWAREEEQRPPVHIMEIDIRMAGNGQAAVRVPALRRRLLAVVRAEVAVHIVEPFPDRLERDVAAEEAPRDRDRIHALGQGLDLLAQHQHGRRLRRAQEHAQIRPQGVLQIFNGPEAQGEATHDRRDRVGPPVRPGGPGGRRELSEHAPHSQATQCPIEHQRAGVPRGPRLGECGRGRRRRLGDRGRERGQGLLDDRRRGLQREPVGRGDGIEQRRDRDMGQRPSRARDPRGNVAQGVALLAELAAAGFQPRRHLARPLGAGPARHQRRGPTLAQLPPKAAQRHGMEIKGGRDLLVGERQDLSQLRRDHALGTTVVTGIARDQVTVEEDRAVIVGAEDLQARRERAEIGQGGGGGVGHAHSLRQPLDISNNYLTRRHRIKRLFSVDFERAAIVL
jgi:hypothetical protein